MQTKTIAAIIAVIIAVSTLSVVGATCGPVATSNQIQEAPSQSPPPKEWASWYDPYAAKAGVFYDEGSGSWCSNSLNVELAAMHAAFDMQDVGNHATAEQQAQQEANLRARYHELGIYA